ncbi:hypothetical protein WJX75_005382 [Coccomyxa subellipsoidea]|uniref:Uncharacterized protein n=1 Tax=Coccomyxa subellipsoidea TaxID=248742 RepID=A0ABR2Z3R8_9CHLO
MSRGTRICARRQQRSGRSRHVAVQYEVYESLKAQECQVPPLYIQAIDMENVGNMELWTQWSYAKGLPSERCPDRHGESSPDGFRGALGSCDPWLRSYPYYRISVMAASGMRAPFWCSLQVPP